MRTLLKILIFIILGEIIFQAHKHWGIEHVNDIADEPAAQIKPDSIPNTIYLLGDSYTKGLGIAKENRLVNRLNTPGYFVADNSHSSHNWADYVSVIRAFESEYKKGDYIVIGVNWNDVLFNKGAINYILDKPSRETDTSKAVAKKMRKNTKPSGLRKHVHTLYRNSAMISFLSGNIQNTLKRHGIPLPIGDFHYLKEIAYKEKKDEMDRVMKYLTSVNMKYGTRIILYLMPDFNLTNNINYFRDFDDFFELYNNAPGITILNGPELFKDSPDGYYCISVHDGHPNDSAHIRIAKDICNEIADKYSP